MTGRKSGTESSERRKSEKAVSCLELTSCEGGVSKWGSKFFQRSDKGTAVSSCLAVLIHSGIECATDGIFGLDDLDLKGLSSQSMVGFQEILGSGQATRPSANDGNFPYGWHSG